MVYGQESLTPFACGQCLQCRINYCRVWKARIMLEATGYKENSFVTLTMNEDYNRADGSLDIKDFQRYLKRLRKRIGKFRYYGIGEYGPESYRPHYHFILFGYGREVQSFIEKAWNTEKVERGFIDVGDLNNESASYIVGYHVEKIGKKDDYRLGDREPVFMVSSRGKPKYGIGAEAVKKIGETVRKSPGFDKRIIRAIPFGKGNVPLGRYLSDKLSVAQGLSEDAKCAEQKADFCEMIEKYYDESLSQYAINTLDDNYVKRLQREKRHEIFKSRRFI